MKEIRVYVINTELYEQDIDVTSISDEEFMDIAEELGSVYSLKGFEKAFNSFDLFSPSEVNPIESYIRII